MERILVAYDGSEPGKHAAQRAAGLAAKLEGALTLLVVGELIDSGYGTVVPVVDKEVYDNLLAEGLDALRAAGLEPNGRVVWGAPAAKIVETARELQATLIVVGHRGHGGLKSLLLGSVAKHVIDHAECSVLVVR